MKAYVIGLVACLAVVMAKAEPDFAPVMQKFAGECAKELNFDMSKLKPNEKPSPEMMKTKEFKCMEKCIVVKAGLCSEDGEPNVAKVKEMFKADDAALAHVKTCSSENKQADSCERVAAIRDCIMKNIKG